MAKKNATATLTEEQKLAQQLGSGVENTNPEDSANLGGNEEIDFDFALLNELDASQALRKERLFKPMGTVRAFLGNGGKIKPVSTRNLAKQDGTDVQVWLIPADGKAMRKATCSSYQSELIRSGEMSIQQLAVMMMNLTESASGEKYIKLSSPIDSVDTAEVEIKDTDEISFVPQDIDISNIRFR